MPEQFARVSGERLVNTSITGPQTEPRTVGLVGGGYVVVWTDQATTGNYESRGQVFDNAGNKVGSEFLINTNAAGNQFQPKVAALTTGGFVVSFTDGNGDGATNTGIRVQMFDAVGGKAGSEFTANQTTAGNQLLSMIGAVPGGGFIVSWQESSATLGDVRARFFDSSGAPVAGEFTVNTATTNSQTNGWPVALANGNIVIVWQDSGGADGSGLGIRAQMYTSAGATIGTEFGVNTTTTGGQGNHSVTALKNGGFVVTWEDNSTVGDSSAGSVKGQVFDNDGVKVGSQFLVNTTTLFAQLKPSVAALDSGGFVIAWNDQSGIGGDTQDSGSDAIKAQVFTATGAKDGIEFLVNTTTAQDQILPTVAGLTNGGFAISWVDASGTIDTNGLGIVTQVFASTDGTITDIVLSNATVSETQPENTIVGTLSADGAITVARTLTYTIVSDSTGGGFSIKGDKLVVADNQKLDFETSASASVTVQVSDGQGHSYQEALTIAVSDVASEARWHAGNDIAVNTPINTDQSLQAIAALTGGGFVIAWADASTTSGDVRAQRFDADGNKLGGEFLVNATTTGAQATPSVVGTADGGFLVVWQDGSTTPSGIRGQFFDASGGTIGAEFRIDDGTGAATIPEVTLLNSGNFMVAWADASGDGGTAPAGGIRGQLIDSTGAKVGSEFTLNAQINNTQSDPAIATTATGFVATWTDAVSPQVIRAQFFDNTGATVGGELQVNTLTANNQLKPTATVLAGGNVLFTWWDNSGAGGDNSNGGIKGRLYDAAGAPLAGEFLMNTTIAGDQDAPRVTALPGGGFMLVFEDRSEAGLANIRAQEFDASGNKVGAEFIATYDTGYLQKVPAIALLADGSWALSWYDGKNIGANDPLGWEIEARVFSPAVAAADPVATTDNVTAESGVATTYSAASLLGNDTHAFGTLSIVSVTSGSNGTAVRNPDGSVTFTSTSAYTGPASFTYTISDGEGGTATGQVNVNVTSANTAPTGVANAGATVAEGDEVTLTAAMLEFDDAEQADTAITYTVTTLATNGTLQLGGVALGLGDTFTQDDIANGRVTYLHDGSETTGATFGFSVSDGAGGTVAGQSFAFTVTPADDAPVHGLPATILGLEDSAVMLNGGIAIDPPPAWIADVDSTSVTTTLSADDGSFTTTGWGSALVTGSGVGSPGTELEFAL